MVNRIDVRTFAPPSAPSVAEATPTAQTQPPTAPSLWPGQGDAGGAVERSNVGSLPMQPGETYQECVLRYRRAGEDRARWEAASGGLSEGLTTGAVAGAGIGGAIGKTPVAIGAGAAVGAVTVGALKAYADYQKAGPAGAAMGESEGRLVCDGKPGSPSNPAPAAAQAPRPAAPAAPTASAAPPPPPPAAPAVPAASTPPPAVSAPPTAPAPGPVCVEDEAKGVSVCK
jgi:hypothetical protein